MVVISSCSPSFFHSSSLSFSSFSFSFLCLLKSFSLSPFFITSLVCLIATIIMSTYGSVLRVHTFGESHGVAVGCIIDGLPSRLPLAPARDIQPQLNRRRPGQSFLSTQRNEKDQVQLLSGVENGYTLGTPLTMIVWNEDRKPSDYTDFSSSIPRPGHGDYTYHMKYHIHAKSGGGRSSARETIARVAAGAVIEKWLRLEYKTKIVAWVDQIGDISIPGPIRREWARSPPSREDVDRLGFVRMSCDGNFFLDAEGKLYDRSGEELKDDKHRQKARLLFASPADRSTAGGGGGGAGEKGVETRCPYPSIAVKMAAKIHEIRELGDTIGGCISCAVVRPPLGLGEPCFDKVEAELAKAMMSLPATKGFEIGEGFASVSMRGSSHNDPFVSFHPSPSTHHPTVNSSDCSSPPPLPPPSSSSLSAAGPRTSASPSSAKSRSSGVNGKTSAASHPVSASSCISSLSPNSSSSSSPAASCQQQGRSSSSSTSAASSSSSPPASAQQEESPQPTSEHSSSSSRSNSSSDSNSNNSDHSAHQRQTKTDQPSSSLTSKTQKPPSSSSHSVSSSAPSSPPPVASPSPCEEGESKISPSVAVGEEKDRKKSEEEKDPPASSSSLQPSTIGEGGGEGGGGRGRSIRSSSGQRTPSYKPTTNNRASATSSQGGGGGAEMKIKSTGMAANEGKGEEGETSLQGSTVPGVGGSDLSLLRCESNHAGGVLAGISSGENLFFRVAFKPVSSISIEQHTADYTGKPRKLAVKGRHDPCILPRSPPLVESMAALVVGDLCLRQRAREGPKPLLVFP